MRTSGRTGERFYGAICSLPLFLAFVAPGAIVSLAGDAARWPRPVVYALTWSGVGASVLMLAWGVVLILRAARIGERRVVLLLALETAVASFPAVVIAAYAIAFRVL